MLEGRLKAIPLFMACSTEDELRRVAATSSTLSFTAGTVLASEGEMGHEFMVIADGTSRGLREGGGCRQAGAGRLLRRGGPARRRSPHKATVTATSDLVVRVIEERDFSLLVYDSVGAGPL